MVLFLRLSFRTTYLAPAADSFITVLKTSIVEALAEYPLHNHGEPRNESRDPALGCISSDRFARLVAREWTDSTGKFKVKAEFVEFKEGIVRLAKEDGQIISFPLGRLSATDQKYVHERAASSQPPRVEAWNGSPRLTLKGHSKTVKSVTFSPDGVTIATGSWDGTVKLWDAGTGRQRTTLDAFKLGVNSVAYSPDGADPGSRRMEGRDDHALEHDNGQES